MANLITNQKEEYFKKIKYGLFPVSFNGCGIIATYNAFILLGLEPPDFKELVKTFWHSGIAVMFGLGGNNVYLTHKVLARLGLGYEKVKLSGMTNDKTGDAANSNKNDGVYIMSVWNKKPPFHGMHTIACQIKDGTPTTYNMYSNAGVVNEPLESLAGKRLIRAYRVYVHK